ncbi:MAG: 2Fe-2S iron-sulfur cluster-binding protein [Pseudomonadota bacterium]
MTRYFSDKKRPPHLGPYPLERLARVDSMSSSLDVPKLNPVSFHRSDDPASIVNAMRDYQAMMDAIRSGLINKGKSEIPLDLSERAQHIKSFGYFHDVSMVGICKLGDDCFLDAPIENPDVTRLGEDLRTKQTKTFAAGIDVIMAELKEAMDIPAATAHTHTHAIVLLHEFPRDPGADESGCEWIQNAQEARAAFLGTEAACVLAHYIRLLGFDARSHSLSATDVHLNRLAVLAGLATVEDGQLHNPYLANRFVVTAISTNLEFACDKPLASWSQQPKHKTHGLAWKWGVGFAKNASNHIPYANREYVQGALPFEKLKRVDSPTTYMDEAHIPRVPKRTDIFARAQFGDMGKSLEDGARNGLYVRKTAPSMAQRKPMSAFVLLQNKSDTESIAEHTSTIDPQLNAERIKATCYFLGIDAVGISRCPEWAFYSHDAAGDPIKPTHDHAISMLIDQKYDALDGSSGDDWISVALSMREYLRFSLLGGVVAEQIRRLGYGAKAHTATDGDVLQPPLLLLSGLGEVSRIGEVILNPYLGPRLKSGVVTTDMPMTHDRPIDFGLQKFCESCNKCARECPSGAITAGPKLMFNGYEIWKSDSQRCATYRITSPSGAMCGRCMKTCPWNLEGLFSEKPFRWAAMNVPLAAPLLAKMDDVVGNGGLNTTKKWWWDLEIQEDEGYRPTVHGSHARDLQTDLKINYEDQTLAVYPADQAPHPWPFPFPMEREKGIEAYQALVTAEQYKAKLREGDTEGLFHIYKDSGEEPVLQVNVAKAEVLSPDTTQFQLSRQDGEPLPEWRAGAHIDVVVAPGFIRQYSLCGDPKNRQHYEIAVLREPEGRGGSKLLHRIFSEGRRVFVSKPINHFPLEGSARHSYLMGGGIGVTPMITMAHELHHSNRPFEFHYSCSSRESAAFLKLLESMPWADRVIVHISQEGTRADLDSILSNYQSGDHVYTCGPDRYMEAVLATAENMGFPQDARHFEYFSVPDAPDYVNHEFVLKLMKSGREVRVPKEKTATDVLAEHGIHVDTKCSDGICGVCRCGLISGEVEHRDFVLSNKQRADSIILCQSRAKEAGGIIEIDL